MKYGDYEHRGQNRSRFILNKLGDDAFRQAVRDAVAKAKAEGDYRLTLAVPTTASSKMAALANRNRKAFITSNTSLWAARRK